MFAAIDSEIYAVYEMKKKKTAHYLNRQLFVFMCTDRVGHCMQYGHKSYFNF